MRKIPTLFLRDPENMARVVPAPNADAAWVFAGQGVATRKYDGTCVAYARMPLADTAAAESDATLSELRWWARREVKPGKPHPDNYVPVQLDATTGKLTGFEPIEQSPFRDLHAEALAADVRLLGAGDGGAWGVGTYELIGPRINGNPDRAAEHTLIEHGLAMPLPEVDDLIRQVGLTERDPEAACALLDSYLSILPYEGIVWHGPLGRMAKLKRRDFGHAWPITDQA